MYMEDKEKNDNVVKLMISKGENKNIEKEDGLKNLEVEMKKENKKVVEVILENEKRGKVSINEINIDEKKDEWKDENLIMKNEKKKDVN